MEGRARSTRDGFYARPGSCGEWIVGQRKMGRKKGELSEVVISTDEGPSQARTVPIDAADKDHFSLALCEPDKPFIAQQRWYCTVEGEGSHFLNAGCLQPLMLGTLRSDLKKRLYLTTITLSLFFQGIGSPF